MKGDVEERIGGTNSTHTKKNKCIYFTCKKYISRWKHLMKLYENIQVDLKGKNLCVCVYGMSSSD